MTRNRRENFRSRFLVAAAINVSKYDLAQAARILARHNIFFTVARRVLLTPRKSA